MRLHAAAPHHRLGPPAPSPAHATTAERALLLAGKVEDMINTVVRQIAFYSFERAVHTERRNGELTAQLSAKSG